MSKSLLLSTGLGIILLFVGNASGQVSLPLVTDPLVTDPLVLKELKVSAEQARKLRSLVDGLRDNQWAETTRILNQDPRDPQRIEKLILFAQKIDNATRKDIAEVLNPEQIKRFEQLLIQKRGVAAFSTQEVAKRMNFTTEQLVFKAQFVVQMNRIILAKPRSKDWKEKMDEANTGGVRKIVANMTDEQRITWKELTGEPFAFGKD